MPKTSSTTYSVIVTSNFKKEVKVLLKKYPSLKNELLDLVEKLEKNPRTGTPLGKDCFKIRLAIRSKGKGKRAGGRIISCVKVTAFKVFLLSIYDKSNQESVSDKELDMLLEIAGLKV